MTPSHRFAAFALLAGLMGGATASAQTAYVPDASSEENVGSATQDLQGRPNSANSSACGTCSTTGLHTEVPTLAVLGGVLALGAVVVRRRRG